MIRLKNEKEIAGIRESGRLLAGTLEELKKLVAPGISTQEMDSFARSWIESHGGKPAFLGYMNYPASLCVSLNNEVIHGIPGPRKLRQGDIVSIDLGVDLNGYFSDAAITIAVGATSRKREKLAQITRECL
ncbi:MAG TPA: M24 family metallopeptidase, partial [Spirochaetia bacterium]|nr:M24 family metallopeptidase [Spirochaetia bacterium]